VLLTEKRGNSLAKPSHANIHTAVSLTSALKKYVPAPLRPYARALKQAITPRKRMTYEERLKAELHVFSAKQQIYDLPAIAHYWSNKFLVPMIEPLGFRNSMEMFRNHIAQVCARYPDQTCSVLSIACGDSAPDINTAQWLLENNIRNFQFECRDLNEEVLSRGRHSASEKGLDHHFTFVPSDINAWEPDRQYHVVLAIQCLHHFVELERLFDKIQRLLHPSGFFMTDDMIGRNGHRRWPEAKKHVKRLWKELPMEYKRNHSFGTQDKRVDDRDYYEGSFEGIRSQDILPLLVKRFHFEAFAGFGNIVDVFIDPRYGPNFDPQKEWDRTFIDKVHALDIREIDSGRVKPTHMYAAMTVTPVANPKFIRHWNAEFCVRHP
jgi:ubiquinone/menaquinone biosynthesis C-methylase UbiE